MDWINQLNRAIKYIEENLTEELDIEVIAKIAHCSVFNFQRMFSYISGVTLAEYIKRRKMSLAAVDLQTGNVKVVDIALKYGYQSPTAFNRAFQSVHGFAPSKVTEVGAILKSHPPISFKLTVKGVIEMAFKIENKDKIRILGLSIPIGDDPTIAYQEAESLWVKVFYENSSTDSDGTPLDYGPILHELNSVCRSEYNGFFAIEMGRRLTGSNNTEFIIGVASDEPATEKLKEFYIPKHSWAVFNGENYFTQEFADAENAITFDARIYAEWLPTSGYTLANDLDVSFIHATKDLESATFEQWVPVKKG